MRMSSSGGAASVAASAPKVNGKAGMVFYNNGQFYTRAPIAGAGVHLGDELGIESFGFVVRTAAHPVGQLSDIDLATVADASIPIHGGNSFSFRSLILDRFSDPITSLKIGLFTEKGGTGLAMIAGGTVVTPIAAPSPANSKEMSCVFSLAGLPVMNPQWVHLRVTAANGAASTCRATLHADIVDPVPSSLVLGDQQWL